MSDHSSDVYMPNIPDCQGQSLKLDCVSQSLFVSVELHSILASITTLTGQLIIEV